ncbi:uncharacterized protein BX664DRAFT_320889 [Halteromyces radiatus]|uniref:uncharacterized protein n=1 Tax=Halteromyces radiatus TaxID=101107 RepID=UPI00221FBB88|nr:uncharacterized protein BX664DRAFT_320889 [Halteromyces radiatus]KAI8099269.1 hypothetical protein BX664DRAFT_320889 [Halteromyces radiatus]
MSNETDFQEKLQKGYNMLTSNLQELYNKDMDDRRQLEQIQKDMAKCQVKDDSTKESSFDQDKLRDTMQKLCVILSHDATKLTLACKPPRKPQDAIKMVDEMSNTLYRIVGFYYDIPLNGQYMINTYRKAYKTFIDRLLRGAISLLVSFMDSDRAAACSSSSSSSFMLSTAALWETCKSASHLPANNQQAVAAEWKVLLETLDDVKNETNDMVPRDGEMNDDHDSGIAADEEDEDDMAMDMDVDPQVARQCVSLVGLTYLLFQKIQKRCTFSDSLLAQGKAVAEEVDVMVSKAYDLEPEEMVVVMQEYVNKVDSLIKVASNASNQENDSVWFNMCATKLSAIIGST